MTCDAMLASDPQPLVAASPPDARPAHYRLSTETWAIVLEEYVQGATAPELALKWRVSQHAIRKRITQHGATKREHGDREARRQAVERADWARRQAEATPEARAARLFDPLGPDDVEGEDAGALSRAALMASGRAMRGQLWAEAKALSGLAESYGRMAERIKAAPTRYRDYGTSDLEGARAALRYILDQTGADPERSEAMLDAMYPGVPG